MGKIKWFLINLLNWFLVITNWLAAIFVIIVIESVSVYLVQVEIVQFNPNLPFAETIYYLGLGGVLIPVVTYFGDRSSKIFKGKL